MAETESAQLAFIDVRYRSQVRLEAPEISGISFIGRRCRSFPFTSSRAKFGDRVGDWEIFDGR